MNDNILNYKTKLCRFFEKYGKCDKNHKCTYAHGVNELNPINKECRYGIDCYNEKCKFNHPNEWKFYNINKNEDIINLNNEIFSQLNKYNSDIEKNEIKEEELIKPELTLTINGINIDNIEDLNYFIEENKKETPINICKKNIVNMVKNSEEFINTIKQNFDNLFIETKDPCLNNYYINAKINLNKILSDILLFEKNYEEIMKYIEHK